MTLTPLNCGAHQKGRADRRNRASLACGTRVATLRGRASGLTFGNTARRTVVGEIDNIAALLVFSPT